MAPTNSYAVRTDLELLDIWRGGDKQGLDELLLRYNVELQRFLGTRLVEPSACVDLIQGIMEALLQALPRHRGCSSVRTYIMRVARNKLNEYLRLRYRAQEREAQDEFDSGKVCFEHIYDRSLSSILGAKQRSEQLRRLLETLPIDDQSMLQLRYWEELSASEIGEVFEMSEDAVRSKLRRLREKLRVLIHADDEAVLSQLLQARDDSPV
ncbi:MAG: sigma-70 family RNA polymerase sigma factor [Myxococcota bacterium]